jgi:hypothetical protein
MADNTEFYAVLTEFISSLQSRFQSIGASPAGNIEGRVSALEGRMESIEQRLSVPPLAPARRLQSAEIEWLRANREEIRGKYAGKWIAVLNDRLLGYSDSLKDLYDQVKAQNIENASYVHVGEPITPPA